jgi:hypothetical protein
MGGPSPGPATAHQHRADTMHIGEAADQDLLDQLSVFREAATRRVVALRERLHRAEAFADGLRNHLERNGLG